MKILHLCLAAFYVDNNSYQENLLPKMHAKTGHNVKIIASTETYIDKKVLGYVAPSEYVNADGIPVKRIPYSKLFPKKLVHKLRLYPRLYKEIAAFSPDFIFIHDVQFLSILSVKKYLKKHPNVIAAADGHADFNNSARNFVSYRLLHKIIYRFCARTIMPYVKRFFGTLPARVDFFADVYGIPRSKLALLPMGADDDLLLKIRENGLGKKIREENGIAPEDFLIVTGGKLNSARPETLTVLKAVAAMNDPHVKLIFFGNVADEYLSDFNRICLSPRIINAGWLETEKTYEYMAAGDLVVFPGLHSVMWEQAVALGKPCVFRKLKGFDHVDIGGNAVFLEEISEKTITDVINSLVNKENGKYAAMYNAAQSAAKNDFLYSRIAEKSITV